MGLSTKGKVAVGVFIGAAILMNQPSQPSYENDGNQYVSEDTSGYADENNEDVQEETVNEEQTTDSDGASLEEETQEEQQETSQEEETQEEEQQEEKKSAREILSEKGFPESRLNQVYKDASDAASMVMAAGNSGIHKLEFQISKDGTEILVVFSNGTVEECWAPANIIDENTLRMYYKDNTMDFVWKEGEDTWIPGIRVSATGPMISELVDEFDGRFLQ